MEELFKDEEFKALMEEIVSSFKTILEKIESPNPEDKAEGMKQAEELQKRLQEKTKALLTKLGITEEQFQEMMKNPALLTSSLKAEGLKDKIPKLPS